MSAISLKSITGITSITTPAGVDNVFTVHTNDTTERFRVDQTGNLNIAGIVTVTKDLDVDGHTNLDNVSVAGVTTFTGTVNTAAINATGNIDINDDGDKLRIGASDDLQIYHSTFNYIESHNDSEIHINANTGGSVENMAKFKPNGAVELYYNNIKMLETNIPSGHNGEVILGQKIHVRHTASGNGQIYPNSGNLYLNAKQGETSILAVADAGVHLNYNNSQKFVTTNTGATVTGILTATSFSGSGANLTSLPAQATISNNADDRVITGGSGVNLNGESTMTYTSNLLKLATGSSTSTDAELLHLVGGGTSNRGLKISTGRASGAAQNHGAAIYDAINSESSGYGSQHRFKIAGTDCFTIGYNGDFGFVGINDNVPYPDSVGGNTVNTCLELGSPSGTDTSSVIKFIGRDGSGNANKCQIQWAGANNRFDITVNGNQALQIQPNKDVEVTDGNLVIGTSGHGIDFSATGDGASVSNKSEILDDYEEGSFTPTMSVEGQGSNASLALAIGTYTKVGAMVNIWIEAQFNGIPSGRSTSNAWQFGGLPFTSQAYTVAPSGLRDYRFPMIAMAVDTSGTYGSNGHFLFRLFDNQTAGRIEWQHSDLELKNASLFIKDGTMIQIHACYPDF